MDKEIKKRLSFDEVFEEAVKEFRQEHGVLEGDDEMFDGIKEVCMIFLKHGYREGYKKGLQVNAP